MSKYIFILFLLGCTKSVEHKPTKVLKCVKMVMAMCTSPNIKFFGQYTGYTTKQCNRCAEYKMVEPDDQAK